MDIITIGQAAEILGVTTQTVRRYVAMGQLDASRTMGGHRRLQRQAVEALRDSRSTSSGNVRTVEAG